MKAVGKKEISFEEMVIEAVDPGEGEVVFKRPVVRRNVTAYRWEVLVGAHEIARLVKLGKTSVMCCLVECTDDEIDFARMVDVRIDSVVGLDQQQLTLHILDILEAKVSSIPAVKTGRLGRPTTPRGLIRALVCTQIGIKPSSLSTAESRRRAREMVANDDAPPEVLTSLGMDLSEAFVAEMSAIQAVLHAAKLELAKSVRKVKALKQREFPQAKLNLLLATAEEYRKAIDASIPRSLCPSCKGIEGYQELCPCCLTTGWVNAEQLKDAPASLKDPVKPMIMVAGIEKSVEELMNEAERGEPDAQQAASGDWF